MASPPVQVPEQPFEACASTASLFLYTQGPTILCLHHDTLALERRFENHQQDISFISVDNVSERGQGRLVVSYDVGQTAIVWDLFTGTEIARFTSFEPLLVASWMRNGSVAFGNTKGEVILFEPATSEHISTRTVPEPITALAPGADHRTYAIGYQNGSIVIATLHPTFNILHTLNTSRGPSPVIGLAWHTSSAKQKSDMLASQAMNGDLRVWSVAKPTEKEAPRTIRVLKRPDVEVSGPQWMAWSKNGKIVQYMSGETYAWDVRTKNVSNERIPTIENVRGIANYGPTATLFTTGPGFTIQQYDLDGLAMVANVQHPPISSQDVIPLQMQEPPDHKEVSSGSEGRQTPSETNSKASERSQTIPFSPPKSGTSFSSSVSNHERGGGTPGHVRQTSTPGPKSSRRDRSRLRNEVQFSPADKSIDLFPFTRTRINDVPYGHHQPLDETNLSADGLRQRIMSMVFGWEGDVDSLIQDEFSRHPPGSPGAILLSQWLGMSDTDDMVSMITSGPVTMSDWVLLAFSQMNGQTQANKIGQAFVQKLLGLGDVHTAATILLGIGDRNDAIEVYVSQNYFMEAVLMTCLLMPTDWQRQSFLVRRWGEHVLPQSQQQLATRCFMCTGAEASESWASPAAQQVASFSDDAWKSPMKSPELGPPVIPSHQRKPSSGVTSPVKTPALKLITSFDAQADPSLRFPGLKSDNQTPTNLPWITPIVESAVGESAFSPGAPGQFRSNGGAQSLNQAMGSRSVTPGFRGRLPSIGETPIDVQPPTFPATPFRKAGESAMTSDSEDQQDQTSGHGQPDESLLLPSARYEPEQEAYKPSPQTAVQVGVDKFASIKGLPSPAPGVFEALNDQSGGHNGSRDRKPDGLQLHLQKNPSQSGISEQTVERPMNTRSPLSTGNSLLHSVKTPSTGGRSIDNFIQSLDEANYYSRKHRDQRAQGGRSRSNTDDSVGQSLFLEPRGRDESRHTPRDMRSPSSPVPMSPGEVAQYGNNNNTSGHRAKNSGGSRTRSGSKMRKPGSRNSSARRHNRSTSRNTTSRASNRNDRGRSSDRDDDSPQATPTMDEALRLVTSDRERLRAHQRSSSRRSDRTGSHRDLSTDSNRFTGRSSSRQANRERGSNKEPEPTTTASSNAVAHDENYLLSSKTFGAPTSSMEQTVEPMEQNDENYLLSSKTFGAPTSSTEQTVEPMEQNDENYLLSSKTFGGPEPEERAEEAPEQKDENYLLSSKTFVAPEASTEGADVLTDLKEQKRKELAAAELEARRLSLARNPSAPNIPFPGDIRANTKSPTASLYPIAASPFGQRPQLRQRTPSNRESLGDRSSSGSGSSRSGAPGLPANPRAMRRQSKQNANTGSEEPSPAVPDNTFMLSDARYQGEAERIGRSMSVPVPESQPAIMPTNIPKHPRYNPMLPRSRSTSRSRNIGGHRESARELYSPGGYYGGSPVAAGIEETLETALQQQRQQMQHQQHQRDYNQPPPPPPPPILPELQHLNTPPPPPPPPFLSNSPSCASPRESSGTIDIAIDNESLGRLLPRAMTAGPTATIDLRSSPLSSSSGSGIGGAGMGVRGTDTRRRMSFEHSHRRQRSANESFTSKIKNLARMRSNSNRGMEGWGNTPPPPPPPQHHRSHDGQMPLPYESVRMVEGRI